MEQLQIEDRTPKWNLTPDADILKLAHTTLQGIPMNYSHIKSHQNKIKKAKELSFSAQLNIAADELAVRRREAMPAPCTTVTTPNIHLTINDVIITRDTKNGSWTQPAVFQFSNIIMINTSGAMRHFTA
jgi:hypothetical protein